MCFRLAVLTLLAANPAANPASGPPGGKPHRWTAAEQCVFSQPPVLPYFWDESCKLDNQELGCWADGVHSQCRFCGEEPFTGVECPKDAVVPKNRVCKFDNEPVTPYFWDSSCKLGDLGCLADNEHIGCRFCGVGDYISIKCPPSACLFSNEPWNPYYWDDYCQWGTLGCNADGHHIQCRFCDKVPFQSIQCPESARPPYPDGSCWFPQTKPTISYYWDELCKWGMRGCWADGVNAQCRFCGSYPYDDCPPQPRSTTTDSSATTTVWTSTATSTAVLTSSDTSSVPEEELQP